MILPAVLLGFAWFRAGLSGLWHLVATLVLSGTAWIVVTTFRGLWIRPGTFDLYSDPVNLWIGPLVLAAALGLLGGSLVRGVSGNSTVTRLRAAVVATAFFFLLSMTTGVIAINLPDYTVYAPTRIWASLVVTLFCALTIYASTKEYAGEN